MLIYLSMIETPEERGKFEAIYETYRQLMFYIANNILHDARDSEDIVHEAFLKIIEISDQIEVVKCPKTKSLIVTIVERKAIDLYRRKRNKTFLPFHEELANTASFSKTDAFIASNAISEAIIALPAKYREVLILKYSQGFSTEEIGTILSMSAENVKKTIQRAQKKLEILLDEEVLP